LHIIGIGPGDPASLTAEARTLLAAAEEIVGYTLYLDLLGQTIAAKRRHAFPIGAEATRARAALDLAARGQVVALVSSGDAGIYALAALVFELLDGQDRPAWNRVDISIAPGISAMQAAAAKAGAPLGHDFCAISLSDLLTPWADIHRRLEAAGEGDFVVALYNPVSARRRHQIEAARDILLR
jgi:cobalt-precorrin 5A hydrolase/precorrin-3B C17-methyltransferase